MNLIIVYFYKHKYVFVLRLWIIIIIERRHYRNVEFASLIAITELMLQSIAKILNSYKYPANPIILITGPFNEIMYLSRE